MLRREEIKGRMRIAALKGMNRWHGMCPVSYSVHKFAVPTPEYRADLA